MRYITPFILIFILITVFTSAGANTTEHHCRECDHYEYNKQFTG